MNEITGVQNIKAAFAAEVQTSKDLYKENTDLTFENLRLKRELEDLRDQNRDCKLALQFAEEAQEEATAQINMLNANIDALVATAQGNDEMLKKMYGTNAYLSGKLEAYEKKGGAK